MFIKNRITKIPKAIKKSAVARIIVLGLSSVISNLFAFLLQAGKTSVSSGFIVIGVILIALYYTKDIIKSILHFFEEKVRLNLEEERKIETSSRAVDVLARVRGKVYDENNNEMPTNKIHNSTKEYLDNLWKFKLHIPSDVIEVILLIIAFVGFILVSTSEIENIVLFLIIISTISILSICFSCRRAKYRERYRNNRKELTEKEMADLNDIVNIEPQDEHHAKYMTKNYASALKKKLYYDRRDSRDTNRLGVFEKIIHAAATLFIIFIKVYEVGIENVNIETILAIIAMQTIYSQIIQSISELIRTFEFYSNDINHIKSYEGDFSKIVEALERENSITICNASTISIPQFKIQYKTSERIYELKNPQEIRLATNEMVVLTGPTGSGKTTFARLISGKTNFEGILDCKYKAIMHQSDARLGSHDVLSEIVFGDEYDEEKLIYILKGLHIYDEICTKNSDIISYLKTTTTRQYSHGQNQRLLIARMLYNLESDTNIIAFDEATSGLNDEIALIVIKFLKEYCHDKLLLIVSHQIDLYEKFADKHFVFNEVENNKYEIVRFK